MGQGPSPGAAAHVYKGLKSLNARRVPHYSNTIPHTRASWGWAPPPRPPCHTSDSSQGCSQGQAGPLSQGTTRSKAGGGEERGRGGLPLPA